jgi:hypothetical protein
MSISIVPRIQLFNYNGQSTYAPTPNISEGFQIPANEFGPSYSVNTGSDGINTDTSLSLGANGQLQVGNSMSLNQLMTLGEGAYGASSTPLSAATSISDNYQGYLNSLSISPQNFNSLMQQPSFTIFNGIVGEKVTTNGEGGIASVSIQPGSLSQEEGTSSNFSFPDTEEIASRAASVQGNDLFLMDPPPAVEQPSKSAQPYLNAQKNSQPTPAQPPIQPNNKLLMQALNMNPGMSTTADNQSNPLLQTLLQLQPKTVENPIFGMNSQLSPDTAVNLAATNAAYGVQLSGQTQANLESIRTGIAQAAQQISPQQVSQARDGMMPLNPFLRSGNNTAQGSFASEGGNNLKQLSTSVDTTDKKSSGGYIPFRMANQNSSKGSSQGQGEQRKPRPRLNAIA